jgi:hypothetical protein
MATALNVLACDQSRKADSPSTNPAAKALATNTAPSPSTSPPPASPPTVPPPAKEAEHPPTCEVEIAGQVRVPKALPEKVRVVVLVADNDCLASDAHVIGRALPSATTGKFSLEVFSRWGSDLTVCAAVEGKPGAPVSVYGKVLSAPVDAHVIGTGIC